MGKPPKIISDRFIQTVCTRLAENKQVRRTLPLGGRLHIDRQLPFLCIYRRPPGRVDTETARHMKYYRRNLANVELATL